MTIEQLADVELAYSTFTAVVGLAADGPAAAPPRHSTSEQTRAGEREHRVA